MEQADINRNSKAQKWFKIALFYLLLIALLGVIMRLKFVVTLSLFNFNYLLHSHSHTAMLGWVYTALFTAFLYSFLPTNVFDNKSYNQLFRLTQIAIAGMFVTFILQGYGAYSISFSTLHIILSYWFIIKFIRDAKSNYAGAAIPLSLKFIFAGLFFLFLSTLGPWGLAVLSSKIKPGSELYARAIYFYLHFLYNGFFTFSLLGLWIKPIDTEINRYNKTLINSGFWALAVITIPAYFLSLLGSDISDGVRLLAVISAFVQLFGCAVFIFIIFTHKNKMILPLSKPGKFLFYLSIISLSLKFVLQLITIFPIFTNAAFLFRDIIMGYIHLVMLGFMTTGILAWFEHEKIINLNGKMAGSGIIIFFSGFLISEILLFSQILITYINLSVIPYQLVLFPAALLMLTGAALLFTSAFISSKK
jgi:hypothetical protein